MNENLTTISEEFPSVKFLRDSFSEAVDIKSL